MTNKKYPYMDEYYDNTPLSDYEYYPQQPMYPSEPMYPMYPMQPMQPQQPPTIPSPGKPGIDVPGLLPAEQSYIENILRLNLGKIATIYMTYENNKDWNAMIYKGKLEAAGRDHIIISDPATGKRYLLLMINLDYITFDEPLNYQPPRR